VMNDCNADSKVEPGIRVWEIESVSNE
jgi:hypothetical protein